MMKTSFSLSSLRGSNQVQTAPTRAYHSLTKKRKQYDQEAWMRCWSGSMPRDENKDDFWAALQPNYNYIMDNQLIESCTEVNGELLNLDGEMCSFRDLASQFSELYSWLNSIQESVYLKDDGNPKITSLRQLEEMERRNYRRIAFIEQATRLVQVYPEIKDEVNWRITHLNSKWDAVKQAISLADPQENQTDIEHEVRCLRKWMHEMESRLQPLCFRRDWTLQEIEGKALEHTVLQKDIESHRKIVSSILKLCNKSVSSDARSSSENKKKSTRNRSNLRRAVVGLERRWHLLYLRSLEWQCHIESLHKRFLNQSPGDVSIFCDSESDEEPAYKQPRLSSQKSSSSPHSSRSQSLATTSQCYSSASSDNEICTSSESDGEFYFEDGIEATCVLVNKMTDLNKDSQNNYKHEMDTITQSQIKENHKTEHKKSEDRKKKRISKHFPPEVCAPTTKIDYNGPNNVTYYCQHRDIESGDSHTMDQSSEDEWTYTTEYLQPQQNIEVKTQTEDCVDSPERKPLQPMKLQFATSSPRPQQNISKLTKDELDRLVQNAEKLVSTPAKVRKSIIEPVKYIRVKEWLNRSTSDIMEMKNKSDDPCDASGEYTTESEGEKESQSSEDLNESVATFRQVGGCTSQATSTEIIADSDLTPTSETIPLHSQLNSESYSTNKVNLRTKRTIKSNRPWSVACISSLQGNRKIHNETTFTQQTLNNFSISESALHELASLSVRGSTSVNSIGTIHSPETPTKVSRKKLRVRKHTTSGRKSESGSDVPLTKSLHKSGSFSGAAAAKHHAIHERNISSEPINLPQSQTSSFDSDDDVNNKTISEQFVAAKETMPDFQLGEQVLNPIQPNNVGVQRDSSPEKNSLNTVGTEEHLSSYSEWDNYLEKYMSEPYSETPDSEAARRLLEFGEDYRNYIDSQSDCCSSLSARTQSQSPAFVGRNKYNRLESSHHHHHVSSIPPALDSESDVEEYRHVIRESRAQLYYTEDVFAKEMAGLETKSDSLQGDFAEIMATCRENLHYLQVLLKVQGNLLSTSELRDVKALLGSWSSMQIQASDLQRARSLDRQIAEMRAELITIAGRTSTKTVQSRQELSKSIDQLKGEIQLLQDRKRILLHMNVAVHRFLTDCSRSSGSNSPSPTANNDTNGTTQNKAIVAASTHLKDRIADLYRLWTETHDSVSEQLNNLEGLHNLWSQLELRLEELQGALRSDEHTLRMLDTALQGGTVSADVATSIRDVAKVLSEKNNTQKSMNTTSTGTSGDGMMNTKSSSTATGVSVVDESKMEINENEKHLNVVDVSGSLSDSGISDEGSEQELSERERRLAVLRRLVRQLENALAPGSEALTLMSQRIEQTETELRDLQRTCRALIVRTAVCAEVRAQKQDASTITNEPVSPISKRRHRGKLTSKVSYTSSDDPDDEPDRRSWLWRVMRASLPFQLAIVALFYVACLLGPHCCDRINNLSMSLTPQLRYIKGPPPV
ncbi:uncharacterized protein LOC123302466 [Chrysoperla carnea]|uniref:uncharacterized protein LOC123302466 n=1 Tax=Chrysoperla carnea TaxID=189513 RepID=UPI001D06C887|nr:uncharacterized protein LOC123302466 [Chrysoperla carnea]